MRLTFADRELEEAYRQPPSGVARLGGPLERSFRKKAWFLEQAPTQMDIRAMRSLHLEKLAGDRAGQHSVRLNDKWRLILVFESDDAGPFIEVVEIVDYH